MHFYRSKYKNARNSVTTHHPTFAWNNDDDDDDDDDR